jgi:hypothetical protein
VSWRALRWVVALVLATAAIGAPGAFAQTPAPSDGDGTVAGQQPSPEQDGKPAAPKPPPAEPKSEDPAPAKPTPEEPKAAKPEPAKPEPVKPEPKTVKPKPTEPKAAKPAPEPKAVKPKPEAPKAAEPKPAELKVPKPAPQALKPATPATDAEHGTPAESKATPQLTVAKAKPPTAKDPRPSHAAAASRQATGSPTPRANRAAVPHATTTYIPATTTYVPEGNHVRASSHQPPAAVVADPSPAPARRTPAPRLAVASAAAAPSVDRRRTALPSLTARSADDTLTLLLAIAIVGLVALLWVREFSRGARPRRYI